MNEYNPDNWIVFKCLGDNPHYKVLAGWGSSYLYGSSWRINSGIVKVDKTENEYIFYGATGSCYKCGKDSYGLRMNNAEIWNKIQNQYGDDVEMLDENTDWLHIDWLIK